MTYGDAMGLLETGNIYMAGKAFMELYRDMMASECYEPEVPYMLGVCRFTVGDFEAAAHWFEEALYIDKKCERAELYLKKAKMRIIGG
jgi:tetratricopeptide (TPR) repeat protein